MPAADDGQLPEPPERKGQQHYSDEVKRTARMMYASGQYASDQAIADILGLSRGRQTIYGWRKAKEPDGQDWDELRHKTATKALQETEARLVETIAEMQRGWIDDVQAVHANVIRPRVIQLQKQAGAEGEGESDLSVSQLMSLIERGAKLEHFLRGQPTERFEAIEGAAAVYEAACEAAQQKVEQEAARIEASDLRPKEKVQALVELIGTYQDEITGALRSFAES